MKETVKCRYAHCKHGGEEVRREDAVQVGKAFYHPDCYKEKEELNEIVQFYIDNFDKTPIMGQLRKTINTLVFDRNYPTDYILFGMRYTKNNNIPLRHPGGLYYMVKNEKIQERYQAMKAKKAVSTAEFKVDSTYAPVEGYEDKGKVKGFGGILH